jgi:hypothetical protein
MTKEAETTRVTSFNNRLFERMRDMNRSWVERLREIHQIESDFGSKLLGAKSPTEATAICHDWMAKRLEVSAGEQRSFTTAWLGLISDVIRSTSATSAHTADRDKKEWTNRDNNKGFIVDAVKT